MSEVKSSLSVMEAAQMDRDLHPFGYENLSLLITGKPRALDHKITGYNRSVLGVGDALSLMELTGGRNTIAAMARQLNGVFVQLPEVGVIEDNEDLLVALMQISTAFGDLSSKAQQAVGNDGVVDLHERAGLLSTAQVMHGKVLHYLALLDRVYGDAEVQALLRDEARSGGVMARFSEVGVGL